MQVGSHSYTADWQHASRTHPAQRWLVRQRPNESWLNNVRGLQSGDSKYITQRSAIVGDRAELSMEVEPCKARCIEGDRRAITNMQAILTIDWLYRQIPQELGWGLILFKTYMYLDSLLNACDSLPTFIIIVEVYKVYYNRRRTIHLV